MVAGVERRGGVVTAIYLTDGVGRVRTNDEDVAALLESHGWRRCSQHEYQAIGRWLRRIRKLPRLKSNGDNRKEEIIP